MGTIYANLQSDVTESTVRSVLVGVNLATGHSPLETLLQFVYPLLAGTTNELSSGRDNTSEFTATKASNPHPHPPKKPESPHISPHSSLPMAAVPRYFQHSGT